MKKYINTAVLLIVAFVLSGCVPQVPDVALSSADKEHIHRVSVDPKIPLPKRASYSGSSTNKFLFNQGLIGLMIATSAVAPEEKNIQNDLIQNNIQLDQMLYQKFQSALKEQTNLKLSAFRYSDAQFKLKVINYGFSNHQQSEKTRLYISVRGKLVNQQGEVLWRKSVFEYLTSPEYQNYTLKDYMNNPEIMKNAFDHVMSDVSDDLVSSLEN